MINNSQQYNYESFLNPVSQFNGRFVYENPINAVNPAIYPKGTMFAEDKPQFVEHFRRL